jgi:hypothetical protein
MGASAEAPGRMEGFLSPRTHLLMAAMREGYLAVVMGRSTPNMVSSVTWDH